MADLVGDAPSTYHITLPEVYLDTPEEDRRVSPSGQTCRTTSTTISSSSTRGSCWWSAPTGGKTRRGLMLALDLEQYDYNRGSTSLIRATEGTIVERIPPRVGSARARRWSCRTSWC